MSRLQNPLLSIVVPVFNEERSIDLFLEMAEPIFARHGRYEILFVNDGSKDNTSSILNAAKAQNPSIVIITFSRNFGKEAATTAGLDYAKGDVVIPIDVDLQDPPELIDEFMTRWRAGADVVYGVRRSRKSDGFIKRTSARYFYKLFNALSPTRIPYNAGDYRLMDRKVVEEIKKLPERTRFMKGLMAWPGFRSEGVEFDRQSRVEGATSWNYWRLWNFALDGITNYSTTPLRLWVYVGGLISLLSFMYAGFIVVHSILTGIDVPGYPSLIVAIMFFGGIQLFSIGLVGEYVGRIYLETKQRPIYVIDSIE
jgi:glycosyltransferase involved in cell wall biosynthesis